MRTIVLLTVAVIYDGDEVGELGGGGGDPKG